MKLSKQKNSVFLWLTLTAFLLALGTGALLWQTMQTMQTDSLPAIREQLDNWKPLLTACRILVIATVALLLPTIYKHLSNRQYLKTVTARQLNTLRWRTVVWLLIIELVLVQNIPAQVIAIWQGTSQ